MLRTLAMVWAGGVLAIVSGCGFQLGNNTVQVGVKVNEQAVNDSAEHVALRLQNELARMGLQATYSSEGDGARITSTTKSGQKFSVVLTRIRGQQGEQTNVHIDWEKNSDSVLWGQLLLVATQVAVSNTPLPYSFEQRQPPTK
jgi:outer membrane lipopolysaccharide assembly protein LptE/RlpB